MNDKALELLKQLREVCGSMRPDLPPLTALKLIGEQHQLFDQLQADLSAQPAMGYRMSLDYEALYTLVIANKEIFGVVHEHGLRCVAAFDNTRDYFTVSWTGMKAYVPKSNIDVFTFECQRLNLEWLSPAPEQGGEAVADTSDPRFNDLVDIVCDRLLCALPSDTFVGQKMNEVLARMNAAPAQLLMAGEAMLKMLWEANDMAVLGSKPSDEWHARKSAVIAAWDAAKTK